MLNFLAKIIIKVFEQVFLRMTCERAAEELGRLARVFTSRLDPDNALRFLFNLDNDLYLQQGSMSVKYGAGTHTKHRHTGYHDFFINNVKSGEKVLDLGCGQGALAFDLAEKGGCNVLGIDLLESNIYKAVEKYSHHDVEYVVGNVLTDMPEREFDVVVLSNVLEHLADRSDFLVSVAGITKAGRFLIRVPIYERDWRVPLKDELGVEWRLDPTHETEYTFESFKDEMRQAFMIIENYEIKWGEIWAEVRPNET